MSLAFSVQQQNQNSRNMQSRKPVSYLNLNIYIQLQVISPKVSSLQLNYAWQKMHSVKLWRGSGGSSPSCPWSCQTGSTSSLGFALMIGILDFMNSVPDAKQNWEAPKLPVERQAAAARGRAFSNLDGGVRQKGRRRKQATQCRGRE